MMVRILLLLLHVQSLGEDLSEYVSQRFSVQLVTAIRLMQISDRLGNVRALDAALVMEMYILTCSSHFFRHIAETRRLDTTIGK